MKMLTSVLIALVIVFVSCADLFAAEPSLKEIIHQIKIYETKKTVKKEDAQYWNLLWSPEVKITPETNIFDKPKNNVALDDSFTKC
jgi:hypothetical protein